MSKQQLEELTKLDGVSRYRFSVVAAQILVDVLKQDPAKLQAVVAGGKNEFLRVAGQIYANQDFKQEDLLRIYEQVERAAANLPMAPGLLTHG